VDQIGEESGEEEDFQEENMEEIQEIDIPYPVEKCKSKVSSRVDMEEGEIIIEKTIKSGRR
jgi:hypothetical protein